MTNFEICADYHQLAKSSQEALLDMTSPCASGKREQCDGEGRVLLLLGNCPHCGSTIAFKVVK